MCALVFAPLNLLSRVVTVYLLWKYPPYGGIFWGENVKYCTRVLFVSLRTSFEALASCVALPLTASELIYFGIFLAC